MEARPVTLPDLDTIHSIGIEGYSVDADGDGRKIRLWIDASYDAIGPVRVFSAERPDDVTVLVVTTPPAYFLGQVGGGDWTEADEAADVADLNATLAVPLGTRRLIDASNGWPVAPLAPWILDRRAADPAPRLRPIGPLGQCDPLNFRGEL